MRKKYWQLALLLSLLKDWRFVLAFGAGIYVSYLCFVHTDKAIRVMCLLIAAFLAFAAYMLYERIFVRLKHKELFVSATGKAAFPGSIRACVVLGTVALGGAVLFAWLGISH